MNDLTKNFQFALEQNVGYMDRQIRGVIGSAMILVAMLSIPESTDMVSLLFLASIPVIASAIIAWDPFYAIIGISSYVDKEENIQQRNWVNSNLGIVDRVFRFVLGTLLLMGALVTGGAEVPVVATLFSIPLILTAVIAWDPIYAMFELNSFARRVDVEAADPGSSDKTLAICYEFPVSKQSANDYPKAA